MIGSAAPAACLYTARHFGAAPVGHGKIDQRQFDAEAALQKLERGPAAARLEHRLAQFTRCRGRAFSHGVVVVDQDQSGVRASAQPDRVDLYRSVRRRAAMHAHPTNRLLGEAEHLAQVKPSPLPSAKALLRT
jgi:hypothetical protein